MSLLAILLGLVVGVCAYGALHRHDKKKPVYDEDSSSWGDRFTNFWMASAGAMIAMAIFGYFLI